MGESSEHAPLPPSGAHRWLYCHASVTAERGFPDKSSPQADEGSAMHEVRARCLRNGENPMDYLGWIFFGGTRRATLANHKRLTYLDAGIDRIRELCGDDIHLLKLTEPRHFFVETHLVFEDRALADVHGTLDFGAYTPAPFNMAEVVISDLKFGTGVPVYAKDNEQQLIYAGLFLDQLTRAERKRVDTVTIIIDQPRMSDAGGEWVVTPAQIERWFDEVVYPAVEAVKGRNPKYAPGLKTCFWCKAKRGCAAYQDFNIKTLGITFDDERDGATFKVDGIAELSAERRAYLTLHADMLKKFLDTVSESVLQDALDGRPVVGLKAVLGNQGARQWVNPDLAAAELVKLLGDKAHETKVISPTVAEELLPRKVMEGLQDLIKREPSKPKLVSADSKKPAITPIKMEDERKANG